MSEYPEFLAPRPNENGSHTSSPSHAVAGLALEQMQARIDLQEKVIAGYKQDLATEKDKRLTAETDLGRALRIIRKHGLNLSDSLGDDDEANAADFLEARPSDDN